MADEQYNCTAKNSCISTEKFIPKIVCTFLNFCILGFVFSFKMMNLIDMCPYGVVL